MQQVTKTSHVLKLEVYQNDIYHGLMLDVCNRTHAGCVQTNMPVLMLDVYHLHTAPRANVPRIRTCRCSCACLPSRDTCSFMFHGFMFHGYVLSHCLCSPSTESAYVPSTAAQRLFIYVPRIPPA